MIDNKLTKENALQIFVLGEERQYYQSFYRTERPQIIQCNVPCRKKETLNDYPPQELRVCEFFRDGEFCFSTKLPLSIINSCPRIRDSYVEEEERDIYRIHQHKEEKILYDEKDIQYLFYPLYYFSQKTQISFATAQTFCRFWQVLDSLSYLDQFNSDDTCILGRCFRNILTKMVEQNETLLSNSILSTEKRASGFLQEWKMKWSEIVNQLADAGLLKFVLRGITCQEIALMHLDSGDLLLLGETIRRDYLKHCLVFSSLPVRHEPNRFIPWFIYQSMFGADTRLEGLNVSLEQYCSSAIKYFTFWSNNLQFTVPKPTLLLAANTNLVRFLCGYYLPVKQRFELCQKLDTFHPNFDICWANGTDGEETSTEHSIDANEIPKLSMSIQPHLFEMYDMEWERTTDLFIESAKALHESEKSTLKFILVQENESENSNQENKIFSLFSRLPNVEIFSKNMTCWKHAEKTIRKISGRFFSQGFRTPAMISETLDFLQAHDKNGKIWNQIPAFNNFVRSFHLIKQLIPEFFQLVTKINWVESEKLIYNSLWEIYCYESCQKEEFIKEAKLLLKKWKQTFFQLTEEELKDEELYSKTLSFSVDVYIPLKTVQTIKKQLDEILYATFHESGYTKQIIDALSEARFEEEMKMRNKSSTNKSSTSSSSPPLCLDDTTSFLLSSTATSSPSPRLPDSPPSLSPTITNSPSFDAFLQSNNEKLALEALEEEKLRQKVYELIERRRRVRSRQKYILHSDIDINSDDDVSNCLSDIHRDQDNNGGESFTSSSSPSRPFETTFSSPRLSPIVTNSPSLSDCSESNRKQLALAREKFARQRKKVDKLFDQKW